MQSPINDVLPIKQFSLGAVKPPFVFIAGAGPGDIGLLTLKTYLIITKYADVVIYDRLIGDEILSLIPDNIEKIYVGKACKDHTMDQDTMNVLIAQKALQGNIVLRLKGGDPFIFGRGAEEVEFLAQQNIDFDIVPGVNAADGCAAYSGISLTHRKYADNVQFITGHKQGDISLNLNWQALSNDNATLVVFMGIANIDIICQKLIDFGKDKNTPAAIIQNGTLKNQNLIISNIKELPSVAKSLAGNLPTLIIIGKVVDMHKRTSNNLKSISLY